MGKVSMVNTIKKSFLILCFISLLYSCYQVPENSKIITVSIPPQKYLVEKIAGNMYTVNVLVPPGASPETYEISPFQMKMLSESQLFFITGHLSFENIWKKKIKSSNKDLRIIDLSEGIELIRSEHRHGDHVHYGTDPHIWVSPKSVRIMAKNMFNALLAFDPEGKEKYISGYEELIAEINQADSILADLFSGNVKRSFLIFHPALGYLARDYELEQIALEYEGKSPPPAHMQEIIDIAREKNIKTVLIQKEFNIENANSIAREIRGEIIQIDPLSGNWYYEIVFIGQTLHRIFNDE